MRFLALLLSACTSAATMAELPPRPPTWCFGVLMIWNSHDRVGYLCTEQKDVCETVAERARRMSSIAKFRAVTECRWTP